MANYKDLKYIFPASSINSGTFTIQFPAFTTSAAILRIS